MSLKIYSLSGLIVNLDFLIFSYLSSFILLHPSSSYISLIEDLFSQLLLKSAKSLLTTARQMAYRAPEAAPSVISEETIILRR